MLPTSCTTVPTSEPDGSLLEPLEGSDPLAGSDPLGDFDPLEALPEEEPSVPLELEPVPG